MAYKPHLRLTLNGVIADGAEIFSMSLSLRPDDSAFTAAVASSSLILALKAHLDGTSSAHWDDMVADCNTYFPNCGAGAHSTLKRVKLAAIGADGKYLTAPKEAAVNTAGGWVGGADHPWQISQKVTLETDGDLGRVKGGWYIPTPRLAFDGASDLWSASDVVSIQNEAETFISNLENVPGLDAHSYKVVVASQGRHNKDGSVRVAADNWDVKRVHMGRRPDVIRRRANHVLESRVSAVTVE